MCNFELYECGSIYIFVISMYIYTVWCLYVKFHCIWVRFDNFVRNGTPYSFLEFEECLNRNFIWKFTNHLNAIRYRLQVTEATNRLTFQIINSWMESWPGLTAILPSETCELFWAIFAFMSALSVREIWCFSLIFFHCFRYRTKSTGYLLFVAVK